MVMHTCGRAVGRGVHSPLNKNGGCLVPKNTYRCIWQYLWHQLLQSQNFLPSDDSKNYLRNTMKQDCQDNCLLFVTRHTRHCKDCLCQRTMQRAFWKNLIRGMHMAEWKMGPPRFKTLCSLWNIHMCSIPPFSNLITIQSSCLTTNEV